MAIDNTGISSLDAGASDITYTGNEGPKSPDQQLMAQADPQVVEMYQQYVFEMEEQGLQPMSFRQFLDQIMSESRMAEGGIARLGYIHGGITHPDGRRGFFTGAQRDTRSGRAMSPGTSADYSPGQDHRETREARGAPSSAGQTYTAPKDYQRTEGDYLDRKVKEKVKNELERERLEKQKDEFEKQLSFTEKLKQNQINRNKVLAMRKLGLLEGPAKGLWGGLYQGLGGVPEWAKDLTYEEIMDAVHTGPYFSQQKTEGDVARFEQGKDLLKRVFEGGPFNTNINIADDGQGITSQYPYPYQTASVPGTDTPTDVDPVTGFPTDAIRFAGGISPVHDFTGIYGQRTIPVKDGGRIRYAGG